jgi:hypothetical protein
MRRERLLGRLLRGGQGGGDFLLRDDFGNVDLAAGAVNGTLATDGHSVRTVTDTEGHLSVAGGKLVINGGKTTPAYGDPAVWYPAVTRKAGMMLLERLTPINAKTAQPLGLDTVPTVSAPNSYITAPSGAVMSALNYVQTLIGANYTVGQPIYLAMIVRASGYMWLVSTGNGWRLMRCANTGTEPSLYPTCSGYDQSFTVNTLRIPQRLWLPAPLLSDGFSVQGVTDGLGHPEGVAGGLGSGGGGIAWHGPTWSVSGGVLKNTPGVGAETVANGGAPGATDWVDTNADEIAGGIALDSSNGSLVSGNGFNGVAQRVDSTGNGCVRFLNTGFPNGTWFRFSLKSRNSDGSTRVNDGAADYLRLTVNTDSALSQNGVYRKASNGGTLLGILTNGAGNWFEIDEVSIKQLNPADLFTVPTQPFPTPDVILDIEITNLVPGTQAGGVLNLDDPLNPKNFVLPYLTSGRCKVDLCLDGAYSTVLDQPATFVAGAHLKVSKETSGGTTTYSVYYNDTLIGSPINSITDARVINNKYHGLFSTDEGNTFGSATVWAKGSEGQYDFLGNLLRNDDDAGEIVITTTAATPVDLRLDLGGYNKAVLADWGDGTVETVTSGLLTHTYASQAARTIRLRQSSHWAGLTKWSLRRADSNIEPGLNMRVSAIPRMVVTISLAYCSGLTGSLAEFPRMLYSLDIINAPITGSIADCPIATNDIRLNSNNNIQYAAGYFVHLSVTKVLNISCGWAQASVDSALHELVLAQAANPTWTTCTLNLSGNAAPSAEGVADANTLRSKGWTVTTA